MSVVPNIPVDLLGAENCSPTPGGRQGNTKQSPLGRVLLVGSSCLVRECLREAMNLRGIEVDTCRFEKPLFLSGSENEYDVLVMFIMRCESRARQIIAELRSRVPHAPAVALIEDPDAEAASFCGMGFSTVILGLPSVSFAVDVVQLLLGSRHLHKCHQSDRDLQSSSAQENFDHEPGAGIPDVCFTARELDLLDLLRRGMQNKQIAYELGISPSTVKAHLRSIMLKLKAKNRTEAGCMLAQQAKRTRETTAQSAQVSGDGKPIQITSTLWLPPSSSTELWRIEDDAGKIAAARNWPNAVCQPAPLTAGHSRRITGHKA